MRAGRTLLAAVFWAGLCGPGHQAFAQSLRPQLKAPTGTMIAAPAAQTPSLPDLPLALPPQGPPVADLPLAAVPAADASPEGRPGRSGSALDPVPPAPAAPSAMPDPVILRTGLFSEIEQRKDPRARKMFLVSVALHAALVSGLFALPASVHEPAPVPKQDVVKVIFYNPPPPPAAPLGKGGSAGKIGLPRAEKPVASKPAAVKPKAAAPEAAKKPVLEAPKVVETPGVTAKLPLPRLPAESVPAARPSVPVKEPEWGTADEGGSVDVAGSGVPWGAVGGVAGGVRGGMPGGVFGGIVGGTGSSLRYDRMPRLLEKPTLPYPERARLMRIQGLVRLEVTIGQNGDVVGVRVVKSIPELDRTAAAIVTMWKFAPAIKDGKPVSSTVSVEVNFVILPSGSQVN